ncbi:hypothetical protein [Flavilitoribacter nigricans]|uniref:Uncharacterized protein n=1 Tax=Flavilitoribacter nigricans (strain ATCC 23147 / DSM 23189 / NBRC 102662 / NCIMB 1420 / SS-2) TaxID=1122177 RepID=A0A2D0N523_FLAN2|nr:hypothetical protein [Flavilitoribacter nigricans]PHN03259.1 hypothetical protein CRP01_28100 [Flavilitoribacter nigricans DSM 23189 = NBRC 102662]
MKPRYYLSLLLLIGLLTACQQKMAQTVSTDAHAELSAPVRMIRKIELLELRSVNLSEDMSVFSTHDDEIILIAYLLQKDADSLKILDVHLFKDLTFDSSKTSYELPYTLAPDTARLADCMAAFMLAELDNEGTEYSIRDTFSRRITRYVDGRPPSRLAVDSLFGTDDFLDLEFLRYDEPYREGEQEVLFKGMQLFDRFEYRLTYRLY